MKESLQRRQDPSHLVWIDLEMTGLDPGVDVILQAALVVTNKDLEPLESFVTDIWQPEEALARMVPFVRQMHEKTGLLPRVAASRTDVGRAEQQILERVSGWCPYRPILCGNTIHSDRKFIDRYMPALAGFLHYRMVDVSSFKVLAGMWLPSNQLYVKPDTAQHDALFDIQQSIAELTHYRRVLMSPAARSE